MKRWIGTIVALVAAVWFHGAAAAEPLLSEGWEAGIESGKWLRTSMEGVGLCLPGYESDGALAVGMGGEGLEGVLTSMTFETTGGLSAAFRFKASQDLPDGVHLAAGFTGADRLEEAGGSESLPSFLASVTLTSPPSQGILYATVHGVFWETCPDDAWHLFQITLTSDGGVRFYRDGVLKFMTVSEIDPAAYPSTRFQICGKGPGEAPPLLCMDDLTVSVYGAECGADFNEDGIVDVLDLQDRADREVQLFAEWYTREWQRPSDRGDFNGDGLIDRRDAMDKVLNATIVFMEWVEGCWSPSVSAPEQDTLEEVLRIPERFRRVMADNQRRNLAIGW